MEYAWVKDIQDRNFICACGNDICTDVVPPRGIRFEGLDGVCKKCGKKLCERAHENGYKSRYWARSDAKMCVRCNENAASGSSKLCQACREKTNKYTKETRDLLKAFGICYRCRKERVPIGQTTCDKCKAREREKAREYRMRKKQAKGDA